MTQLHLGVMCIKLQFNFSKINIVLPCAGATRGGRTITATDDVVCETKMWFAKFALTTAVA